jgi:CHAT domain-containing protein/tetratricopeptide (TPR) repeat protein
MPEAVGEESHGTGLLIVPEGESASSGNWVAQLAQLPDSRSRRRLLSRHLQSQPDPAVLVDQLYGQIMELLRVDLRRAERLAQGLDWLASKLADGYARAQSLRARGHVLYLTSRYLRAAQKYQAAMKTFDRLGLDLQVALTISSMLQSLIYLGKYKQAFRSAQRARKIFAKHGDRLRLARLDSNVGNILHRLDRFTEALDYYGRAHRVFLELEQMGDVPVTLHNMAMCYTGLNRFEDALRTYHEAREYWRQQDKPLLIAEADYNIAYLHYFRGEYTRAIELYQQARLLYQKLGDGYHTALCDLDESEMYVELNLSEEALEMAQRAFLGFQKLGVNYESAKALTFRAMAANQQGNREQTLETLDRARDLFRKETNQAWKALIDIYKALVLAEAGKDRQARALCAAALAHFRKSAMLSRAALCEVLLAQLDLKQKRLAVARRHCQAAFRWLEQANVPAVEFEAHLVMGQVEEELGRRDAAYKAYLRAHEKLESLRSHLLGEEFKIAFLKDKLSVYEGVVYLALQKRSKKGREAAFAFIERAKSRSLADLIAFQISNLTPRLESDRNLGSKLFELQEKLTSANHEVRRAEFEGGSAERVQHLRRESSAYQTRIRRMMSQVDAADREFASLLSAGTVPLDLIRSKIPTGSLILEYYQARGAIYACLLGRDRLELWPVAPAAQVRQIFRLLQFQLSKFRLGPDYVRRFQESLHADTELHLRELYYYLITPIRRRLDAEHLIVVPHGFLHYVPFAALGDGEHSLIDEFSLSGAPSSSVYYLCAERHVSAPAESLVLGIPDPLTPHILEEARTVASSLPNARLFIGGEATHELLRRYAPQSRFIHIATHGLFRQDNPMFSSIRLGTSELNLFDLYQLRLSAELVTLSGCGTGLNVVVGGDELLGLVRGLLYAGAQALLVTLWDVNDESTAQFMKLFYRSMDQCPNKATALQRAMQTLRESHAHPYHWAPFQLIGNFQAG